MLSKQKLSLVRSLYIKKYSYENKLFIIEGEKLLNEALDSNNKLVEEVFILNDALDKWQDKLKRFNITPHVINNKELSQISNLSTPPPILAICRHFSYTYEPDDLTDQVLLYLNEIKDPGNMGTIIRTAEWFGINNILCSPGCVDIYNTKLIQSTMGSLFRVKLFYIEEDQLSFYKDKLPIYAAALNGDDLYKESKISKGIIMMGSESHGLSEGILKIADKIITIPASKQGKPESLNVAVATGIICSHLLK